jgi:hypothetical protein
MTWASLTYACMQLFERVKEKKIAFTHSSCGSRSASPSSLSTISPMGPPHKRRVRATHARPSSSSRCDASEFKFQTKIASDKGVRSLLCFPSSSRSVAAQRACMLSKCTGASAGGEAKVGDDPARRSAGVCACACVRACVCQQHYLPGSPASLSQLFQCLSLTGARI